MIVEVMMISRRLFLCKCRLVTYVTSVAGKSNIRIMGGTCATMKDKKQREASVYCGALLSLLQPLFPSLHLVHYSGNDQKKVIE